MTWQVSLDIDAHECPSNIWLSLYLCVHTNVNCIVTCIIMQTLVLPIMWSDNAGHQSPIPKLPENILAIPSATFRRHY